jgi:RNA polymerase sigma-70 factor (ECF subfamily)
VRALTDVELLEKSRQGDETAFRKLIERHQGAVAGVCMNMLKDKTDAEEIGQKTFIRFYSSMDQFKGNSKLETYLVKIAINLCLNELKRRKKWFSRYRPLDKSDDYREVSSSDKDTQNLVHYALGKLRSEDKLVIVLRSIEGYSIKETASLMGIKEGTVMSKLSRALKKLKVELEKLGYTNG